MKPPGMRGDASFPRDVREDLAAILEILAGPRRANPRLPEGFDELVTEDVARLVGKPLSRVRGALSILAASGAIAFRSQSHGPGKGYGRLWRFVGPGAVDLWEPMHGSRKRRLYATRASAVEAARRTQGPDAEARRVVFEVLPDGKLAPTPRS